MSALAGWGVLLAFAAGFAGALLSDRWIRLAGGLVMVAAASAALATMIGPRGGLWGLGPALALLVLSPGRARPRLAFDPLVRRSATIGALTLGATLAGLQFPIGDLPRPLAIVLWDLAALGLGWQLTALDSDEVVAGAVLAIAGGSALLMVAFPGGVGGVTAATAGALAATPLLTRLGHRHLPGLGAVLLAGAAVTVVALALGPPASASLGDLAFAVRPPALLAVAVLLLGVWAIQRDARGLVAVPATLMLVTGSPALRWAALATAATLVLDPEDGDSRFAWAGLAVLASAAVLGDALDPAPRLRLVSAALAGGWLLLVAGRRAPALLVAIGSLFLSVQVPLLPGDASGRIQLLASITAAFLGAGAVIVPERARRRLSLALILVALATQTTTGALAAILLVLDLLVIVVTAPPDAAAGWQTLRGLARSGWPPTVAFAGRTLGVLAAIETSRLLGVVALGLLLGLLLAPMFTASPEAAPAGSRVRGLVLAVVSLGTGLAPAWVARLGHL